MGTFKPGQSGNPGGRKRMPRSVLAACREHTDEAIATLVKCLSSKSDAVKVKAADSLLDRAWGRPTQHIESKGIALTDSITVYIPDNGRAKKGK